MFSNKYKFKTKLYIFLLYKNIDQNHGVRLKYNKTPNIRSPIIYTIKYTGSISGNKIWEQYCNF